MVVDGVTCDGARASAEFSFVEETCAAREPVVNLVGAAIPDLSPPPGPRPTYARSCEVLETQ